ncbi:MAG: DMT family transporter [Ignavibacteria bacterium]|jgi:drug/metabolite transporter (DMT)-like permease
MNEKYKGVFAVVSANVIFGLNIPVTKALMADWMTPVGYTFSRMLFGAVVFWLVSLFTKKEKIAGKDFGIILIGGLLGFVGTQFLFSQSLKLTSPVIFSLLMALTPVVVLLISAVFLKEIVQRQKMIGVVLSISGAAFIILQTQSSSGGSNNLLGIFFSILCAVCYAVYLILTREVSKKYQPITIVKWMFLVSALVITPFSFSELPNQTIYGNDTSIMGFMLLGFALFFSTLIAFFLLPVALNRLQASTVSIFMNLQPIVASVVAIIVGQDILTWDKPIAVVLVVAGVYLVTKQKDIMRLKAINEEPAIVIEN